MLSPVLSHRVYRCKHKLVCTLCLGREHIFTASWRLLAIPSSKLPERNVPVVWSVRPGYFRENGRRDVWSLIATRLWRPFLKGNFQKTELAYCPDKEIWKKVHKPLQRAGGKMDGKQKKPLGWERLNERGCSTKGHLTCALSIFYSRGMFFLCDVWERTFFFDFQFPTMTWLSLLAYLPPLIKPARIII